MHTINRLVSPGELAPDMHVTVIDLVEAEKSYDDGPALMMGGGPVEARLTGVVMQVKAIDLPFVFLHTLSGNKIVIDTRRCRLKELRSEFVQAVAGQPVDRTSDIDVAELAQKHDAFVAAVGEQLNALGRALREHINAPVATPTAPPLRARLWQAIKWWGPALLIAAGLTLNAIYS